MGTNYITTAPPLAGLFLAREGRIGGMKRRFTVRDLLVITACVAIFVGAATQLETVAAGIVTCMAIILLSPILVDVFTPD